MCCAAGVCRCAEQDANLFDDPPVDAPSTGTRASRANDAEGGESPDSEAYDAADNGTWGSRRHADRGPRFVMPNHAGVNGQHAVSSVAWSGDTASSEGENYGHVETPHETRLREGLSQQLRVSVQHWSVSQARIAMSSSQWFMCRIRSLQGYTDVGQRRRPYSIQEGLHQKARVASLMCCLAMPANVVGLFITHVRDRGMHCFASERRMRACDALTTEPARQVCDWVEHLGLPYRKRFLHHLIDGRLALQLTAHDLKVRCVHSQTLHGESCIANVMLEAGASRR